ncbi:MULTISPECIES: hypothetical protein [unclassified Streptomyces]|uniref:hypothetical protein n=1 Tax=unclassified Streptomyces TaxID=2593676 RepID=UPI002DDA8112|nr:hypothetical protein [Streptomyces sp. NBC_01294]WRZ59601.1 hypothetical protein OG534_25825 [Streptomyces sp. NBC_01294]
MIEYVFLAGGIAGAGWLLRRKHRARAAAGPVPGIPGMARHPAGQGRWKPGRVYAEEGEARWVPPRGAALPLPGARATGLRVPSIKEGISINPGSRIVTCTYEGGGSIEIAVMPLDVRELLEAVPQAESST